MKETRILEISCEAVLFLQRFKQLQLVQLWLCHSLHCQLHVLRAHEEACNIVTILTCIPTKHKKHTLPKHTMAAKRNITQLPTTPSSF